MRRRILAAVATSLVTVGTAVLVVSAPGCNGAADPNKGPTPQTLGGWGFLMYAAGRNESDRAALDATNQVAATKMNGSQANYEIALSGIDLAAPPSVQTRRIYVDANGVAQTFAVSNVGMADAGELANYVVAGVRAIPAKQYCLVIHGHGGLPVKPLLSDAVAPATTTSVFDLAGLDAALASARAATNLAKIDVVVLDVPDSATVEVATVLAKHATYMVALESSAPSCGFNYLSAVQAIAANGAVDARTLATKIANDMSGFVTGSSPRQAGDLVVSCVDLGRMAALNGAINSFSSQLVGDVTSPVNSANAVAVIVSARNAAPEMDLPLRTYDVDLSDFASKISTSGGVALSTTTMAAAANVTSTLSSTIIAAFVSSASYGKAAGLSIHFPPNAAAKSSTYSGQVAAFLAAAPSWGTFLSNYHAALGVVAFGNPLVTIVSAPTVITTNQTFNVTATVTQAPYVTDVTVVITVRVGTSDVVIYRQPSGPPTPGGNIAFTGSGNTVAITSGSTGIPTPLGRRVHGSGRFYSIDADVRYSVVGAQNFRSGIVKLQSVAGVTTTSLQAVAWTPVSALGAIGRNDRLNSGGVTATVFPRTLVVSPGGAISVFSQTVNSVDLPSGGIESLPVSTTSALTSAGSTPATLWVIAETASGGVFGAPKVITIQ